MSSILCLEKCVSDVKAWMMSNKLQMNEDKTDVLLVTAKQIVIIHCQKKVIDNFKKSSFSTVTRSICRLETIEKVVPIQMGH